MGQYKTIFLIASAKLSRTPAFEYARHLAKTTGAKLHLCVFDHSDTIAAMRLLDQKALIAARDAFTEVRRAWARQEAMALRGEGIDASGDACWARPIAEEVLAQVAELKPDLVVKDAQHEPLLKRVFFTPVDWQLLRLCPAPLLLVNSGAGDLPKRIIAAVDAARIGPEDADFNRKIVHDALTLAIQCSAELHLATAFNSYASLGMGSVEAGPVITAELYDALRRGQLEQFSAFAQEFGVAESCRHFVEGTPSFALGELAGANQADVIVVGTTHRQGLERLLLGSTAEGIFEYAPCNILAVKPDGFAQHFEAYMRHPR